MWSMQEFEKTYNQVFDEHGNVKSCGREVTRKLISLCQLVDTNTDFGNRETGFMNTENIKRLHKNLEDDSK